MTITVNEKEFNVSDTTSVSDLFDILDLGSSKGKAVAVNNHVVPKSKWDGHKLVLNDTILLIKATQGG
jgi:sulfur carrier protein